MTTRTSRRAISQVQRISREREYRLHQQREALKAKVNPDQEVSR